MYDNHINLSFLSKIRVLLVSLHDTASANRVRKIPRSGTVRGVLRTTLIASARVMPGSYPGGTCVGIYTKKSEQISEHMLQAAGYLGGIFYEHMHQNAAEGI